MQNYAIIRQDGKTIGLLIGTMNELLETVERVFAGRPNTQISYWSGDAIRCHPEADIISRIAAL